MRTHNSEKPYQCNECHRRFEHKRRALRRHIKRVHKQERSFKCTLCPKAFKRRSAPCRTCRKDAFHEIKSTCISKIVLKNSPFIICNLNDIDVSTQENAKHICAYLQKIFYLPSTICVPINVQSHPAEKY